MALLIKTIGEQGSRIEPVHPENGVNFTLEELQRYVGGYIEALRMKDGKIMWLNEDGKAMQLPVNYIANLIAHSLAHIAHNDCIVGDVLIANATESGDGEPEAA